MHQENKRSHSGGHLLDDQVRNVPIMESHFNRCRSMKVVGEDLATPNSLGAELAIAVIAD